MSVAKLDQIPAQRRTELFHEIARLVGEAGAIDRSLEHIGEGWCIDDTLEEIVQRITAEMKLAGKCRRLAKILKLEDFGDVA
jgi:hypothetical protein